MADVPRLIPAFTFEDKRGRLMEVGETVAGGPPVNVKLSVSDDNVVRGLHYQDEPFAQAKIVRVGAGEILDVTIDLATGDLYEVTLKRDSPFALYVPRGYAHGFLSRAEGTIVVYLSTNAFDAASERAFSPLLQGYDFDWGRPAGQLILSDKDRNAPTFERPASARHLRHDPSGWVEVTPRIKTPR